MKPNLNRLVYRIVAFTAGALSAAVACSSPSPQGGTNTNWMSSCNSNADCKTGLCKCGVCSAQCTSASDCSALAGSKCVSPSEISDGCELSDSICLLACTKDADCSAAGEHAVCGRNVCTVPICVGENTPDCHAASTPTCGTDWQEAQGLFPSCWSGTSDPFLANCGSYHAVATFGKDGYSAYFYDTSGKLVGRGSNSNIGVGCGAFDPSFVFPVASCTPIDGDCRDASVPPTDGGSIDGGVLSGALGGVTATNDGFVAVGYLTTSASGPSSPLVLTSTDGRSWTITTDAPKDGTMGSVAFGNGTIVAVGSGGGANSNIYTKLPGSAWQRKPVGTNDDHVLFGNGVFLVTANVELGATASSDGINWTTASISGQWFGFVDGRFIAFNTFDASKSGYRTSTDGLSWSTPTMPSPPVSWIYSLAKVGNQILGFADGACDGGICTQDAPYVELLGPAGTLPSDLTSSPSQLPAFPPRYQPASIATDGARVVVMTATALHTTSLPVGSTGWSTTDVTAQGWTLADLAYRAGTFVAVGQSGSAPLLASSTDGQHWDPVTITP